MKKKMSEWQLKYFTAVGRIESEIAKILNKDKDAKALEDLLSDISLQIDEDFNRDEITGIIE